MCNEQNFYVIDNKGIFSGPYTKSEAQERSHDWNNTCRHDAPHKVVTVTTHEVAPVFRVVRLRRENGTHIDVKYDPAQGFVGVGAVIHYENLIVFLHNHNLIPTADEYACLLSLKENPYV